MFDFERKSNFNLIHIQIQEFLSNLNFTLYPSNFDFYLIYFNTILRIHSFQLRLLLNKLKTPTYPTHYTLQVKATSQV